MYYTKIKLYINNLPHKYKKIHTSHTTHLNTYSYMQTNAHIELNVTQNKTENKKLKSKK